MNEKGFTAVVIVLLVLVLGGVGGWYYVQLQNSASAPLPTSTHEPTSGEIETTVVPTKVEPTLPPGYIPLPTPTDFSEWKESSVESGYTFKYPPTWEEFQNGPGFYYYRPQNNNNIRLLIGLIPVGEQEISLDQRVEKLFEGYDIKQKENIIVDGKDAIYTVSERYEDGKVTNKVFQVIVERLPANTFTGKDDDKGRKGVPDITLSCSCDFDTERYENDFLGIVSTFRFLD